MFLQARARDDGGMEHLPDTKYGRNQAKTDD